MTTCHGPPSTGRGCAGAGRRGGPQDQVPEGGCLVAGTAIEASLGLFRQGGGTASRNIS